MIDLYMFTTGNCWRCTVALEEMGLPYRVKWLNLRERQQFNPEFLAKNPLGRVPLIEDHAGPGGKPAVIYSSPAILVYLAEKSGKLLPASGPGRAAVLQWLMFVVTDLGMAFDYHFRYAVMLPRGGAAPDDYAIKDTRGLIDRYAAFADRHLAETEYLAGDYSIADVALIPFLGGPRADQDVLARYPNLRRWSERLMQRPAMARAFITEPPKG